MLFFFFKQKTAYEMRISDWSSDVCSSDLLAAPSSKVMADIVAEAFPDGEVTIVEGGVEAATALLACPFNHIFYIGNNTVGRIVMRAAAEHFASVTLEMGGKNPSIVDASADVEDAALKRSEERRGGKECVSTCRSRGSP